MEQLGSHWTDFHENWYLKIFLKSVNKIPRLLKSNKKNGPLHDDILKFMIMYRLIILEWETFHRNVVDKIKTHILYLIAFNIKSFPLRDNLEKYGRAEKEI